MPPITRVPQHVCDSEPGTPQALLKDKRLGLRAPAIADIGSGFHGAHLGIGYSPCITKSRAEGNGYYCFSKQRRCSLAELMRLQGMNPGDLLVKGAPTTGRLVLLTRRGVLLAKRAATKIEAVESLTSKV